MRNQHLRNHSTAFSPHRIAIAALVLCLAAAICLILTRPWTQTIPSLERCRENYSQEQAIQDGLIVVEDDVLLSGEKAWTDFFQKTKQEETAAVLVYQSFPEEENADTVKELRFDGAVYTLRYYDRNSAGEYTLTQKDYPYCTRSFYTIDDIPREYYILAHEPDVEAYSCLSSPPQQDFDSGELDFFLTRAVNRDYTAKASYDVAFTDIDADGIEEKCCLGRGSTSGVFTFTVSIYEEGHDVPETSWTYRTDFFYLSFFRTEDGALQVQGITQPSPGRYEETHRFDMELQGGTLRLVEDAAVISPLSSADE